MDTESCKVLVQTDEAGRVTAINSDAFVSGDGCGERVVVSVVDGLLSRERM